MTGHVILILVNGPFGRLKDEELEVLISYKLILFQMIYDLELKLIKILLR
jgi:hypothetical protein